MTKGPGNRGLSRDDEVPEGYLTMTLPVMPEWIVQR